MLKRIPKSDISIRPFKAYKQWSFDSTDNVISLLEANVTSSELSNGYPKNSIYGQLRAQFYNGNEDNPFLRFGNKSITYSTGIGSDRYMLNDAKVLSIPQIYVGEGIKKGSVLLTDNGIDFKDDSFGNLINAAGDTIYFITFNNNNSEATLYDFLGNFYTITISDVNFNTGVIQGNHLGDAFTANMVSFNLNDVDTGIVIGGPMTADNFEFLQGVAGDDKIGNIFYNQGLVVLTKNPLTKLTTNWELSFKSTKTIYEHEYLLIVNPDEFNVSQNPSAIKEVGFEYSYITGSDNRIYKTVSKPGMKFIRKKSKLETGNELDYRYTSSVDGTTLAGFEHWDLSGSVDSTGSFLAPYITSIGLYDDDCDLIAVAKLPQPIKSEPDFPVNFIVRFDI
jgi:hypothetical protein